jgi:predicted TIM-barrel fold metal-dependent hydrolase
LAQALEPEALMIPGQYGAGKSGGAAFRRGLARLGERGLTYDCWLYHHQIDEFTALARAVPETTFVLDHFGTPLGVGRFAGHHDEIFEQWRLDLADVAACENTVAKLGGLAMPDNGFGFHVAERPPTSDELLTAQRRWYEYTIECFGPERCMFESNFPVDRFSLSSTVYWNAMQKLAASYTDADQSAMFSGTARRVYRLAG